MTGRRKPARVIVLAAQRAGMIDPLAQRFGLSHKALIPVAGKPLITYVLKTLSDHDGVGKIVISSERDIFGALRAVCLDTGVSLDKVANAASADNLADSVIAAASDYDGPIVITTADNALLTSSSIDAMLAALDHSEVAIAMARKTDVFSAHIEGQRRFYRFRDDEYSNCNLYAMRDASALAAAEVFRGGGQFARKVGRVVEAFGIVNLILMRFAMLDLGSAMDRIARRIGRSIAPVILSDGSQAIDVDNDRTLRCVEEIMLARGASKDVARGRRTVTDERGRPLRVHAA